MFLAHGNLDKGHITVDRLGSREAERIAKKYGIIKSGQIKAVVMGADGLELFGLDKDELMRSFLKWRVM